MARTDVVTSLLLSIFIVSDIKAADIPDLSAGNTCTINRLEFDINSLFSDVKGAIKGLENFLGPLSKDGVGVDGSGAESYLVGLVVNQMQKENEDLKKKISELEIEKSRYKDRIIEMDEDEEVASSDSKFVTPSKSSKWPKDCQDIHLHQGTNTSGIFTIYPNKCGIRSKGVSVWCDMSGDDGGWTTILLRRKLSDDKQVDFNRQWRQYRRGFGTPDTEYWIGNENLYMMTNEKRQILRVDMMDWTDKTAFAEYSFFMIDNGDAQYRIHIGGYTGTAGDALTAHSGMLFSTPDRDNDNHNTIHCAADRKSGFWFKGCEHAGPTFPIMPSGLNTKALHWHNWYKNRQTLKAMTFKIKPANCNS